MKPKNCQFTGLNILRALNTNCNQGSNYCVLFGEKFQYCKNLAGNAVTAYGNAVTAYGR